MAKLRKDAGQTYMAKLRRNMFDWFYPDLEIYGYDKKGRDVIEDQQAFN